MRTTTWDDCGDVDGDGSLDPFRIIAKGAAMFIQRFQRCVILAVLGLCATPGVGVGAGPTLKGPIDGVLTVDPNDPGFAAFVGEGTLRSMGRTTAYGEIRFVPGDVPGAWKGVGIMVFVAANRDVLVANVVWKLDAQGNGWLEFRWPGIVAFRDGTIVRSTGRFVGLPYEGLRGTSTFTLSASRTRITMTGEIIDPDPWD